MLRHRLEDGVVDVLRQVQLPVVVEGEGPAAQGLVVVQQVLESGRSQPFELTCPAGTRQSNAPNGTGVFGQKLECEKGTDASPELCGMSNRSTVAPPPSIRHGHCTKKPSD